VKVAPTAESDAGGKNKKANSDDSTVKTNTPANGAANQEKITEKPTKPADFAFSPTAEQTPSNTTDRTLNTIAHGARLYRGLHKIHKGSSRLVSVLAPQWDIDDWKEGDEDFDDDDEDEDEEKYESDDDVSKPTTTETSSKNEKTIVVSKKEVSGSDSEDGSAQKSVVAEVAGRSLVKRYKDWSRYVIWAIMIMFPLLFMRM
jgi:hypothetical protein